MKTKSIGLFTVLVLLPILGNAQLPNHNFNAVNLNNPYGLINLDPDIQPGSYPYCRWGVLQDSTQNNDATLRYTWLTAGTTPQELESDLFLTRSLQTLDTVNWVTGLASRSWTLNSGTANGRVRIKQYEGLAGAFPINLMRKLHFRNIIEGRLFLQTIPSNAKKLIILIHGWNPDSNLSGYGGSEFTALADFPWLEREDIQACLLYAKRAVGNERIEPVLAVSEA